MTDRGASDGDATDDPAATGLIETGAGTTVDTSVLHLSPAERRDRDIGDDEVRAAFLAVARNGDASQKDLRGVELPMLKLDRQTIEGVDRHAIDLRNATIEGISLRFSTLRLPIRLDGASIGDVILDEAHIEESLLAPDAEIAGTFDAFETTFSDDVEFEGARFGGAVTIDEATFTDDVSFDGAQFEDTVAARAVEFYGDSNLLSDNTSFTDATFQAGVDFRQADFGFTHFEGVSFRAEAVFQEATFKGDAEFDDIVFQARANFDEVAFDGDVGFADVEFRSAADFRGATFAGGERALDDDVTFRDARFGARADFEHARFRYSSFERATFTGKANFQEVRFTADTEFIGAAFEAEADFDEARFKEDADFSGTVFAKRCVFRGASFSGGANFLEDNLTFEGASFGADVDFKHAELASANFVGTSFGGKVDFSDTVITDRVDFEATQVEDDAFVDFTRAKIRSGRISQPTDNWVRYDLTLASLGDVNLIANSDDEYRRLLDYFRFCKTEFTEFDGQEFGFGDHRQYLDRNAWAIHEFHEPPGADPAYALDMTPEVIEATYLKAKQSASAVGDKKAAGEFRVKRQQYSRQQNLSVVRDSTVPLWTRIKNLGRASENYFLGITCGHGMRPMRIGFSFILAPLLYVPIYAFGGSLFKTAAGQVSPSEIFTSAGLATLFDIARFSYISYTTIGYGFLGPEGRGAEVLAASEAYLSVILSALLVYALVKRSEM